MALPGFEILYSSVSNSLKSLDDAAIAVTHWNLISNGLKCCGNGENWTESESQSTRNVGSEILPEGWNVDSTIYALRYIDPSSDRKYLLKVVAMDGTLILHLIRCFDEKTVSTSIRSRDFVNDQFSSFQTAYTNLEELNSQLTKELYKGLTEEKDSASTKSKASSWPPQSTSSSSQRPGRSSLLEDNRRGVPPGGIGYMPPRHPYGASPVDPFSVGRADLDPLSGGGGMFMDPSGFRGRGGFGSGGHFGPTPPGFPPGSIPPGARFDPIGPPGVRPNPDPDHERPPDNYDDMFM